MRKYIIYALELACVLAAFSLSYAWAILLHVLR